MDEGDMGEDGYSYGDEMDQPSGNQNMNGMGMDEPYNDNGEEDESPQYEGEDDYGEEDSIQLGNSNPYPK